MYNRDGRRTAHDSKQKADTEGARKTNKQTNKLESTCKFREVHASCIKYIQVGWSVLQVVPVRKLACNCLKVHGSGVDASCMHVSRSRPLRPTPTRYHSTTVTLTSTPEACRLVCLPNTLGRCVLENTLGRRIPKKCI